MNTPAILGTDFSEEAYQWLKNKNIKLPKVTLLHVQDEVKIAGRLGHKLEEFNKIDTIRSMATKKIARHGNHVIIDVPHLLPGMNYPNP